MEIDKNWHFYQVFFLLNTLLNVYFAPTLRFNLVIYILKVSSRYYEQKKGALHHIFLKRKYITSRLTRSERSLINQNYQKNQTSSNLDKLPLI